MTQLNLRHIAVIDIGKTNAKVVLIDGANGTQLGARSRPNTVLADGLYPHMDVDGLWDFILASLAVLHADHGIEGISITTHGACAALMAGDRLALPVLDYEWSGPGATRAEYDARRPPFSESLSPALPVGLNLGAQIFWQAKTWPDRFAGVTAILTYPQYWAWRLTGVLASEVTSLGCHTDLWAPAEGRFSSLVTAMNWTKLFPPLHPAASVLGSLRPDLAERIGLTGAIPVACGIHDSNASLVPHLGAHEPPFTIVSTGTWTILMTVGGDTGALDAGRDSLANVDAFGRAVPTARFMGGREFDGMVPQIAEPTAEDIAHVVSNQIMALPSFTPGVGPFPRHAGTWSHDPDRLSPGQRTAVASLYLALMARTCLDLCGLGRSITIEGPLARNRLFGEALAKLTEALVFVSGDATGTSLGASLLFGGRLPRTGSSNALAPLHAAGLDAYIQTWQRQVAD